MKFIIFVLMYLVIGSAYSQSFFVSPILGFKVSVNRLEYSGVLKTKYYRFQSRELQFGNAFRFGAKLGYRKNNHVFSIGIQDDGVVSAYKIYIPHVQSSGVITPGLFYGSSRTNQTKCFFAYQYFFGKDDFKSKIGVGISVSMVYRAGGKGVMKTSTIGFTEQIINDYTVFNYEHIGFTDSRNKSIQLGLGFTYSIFYCSKYLFDFNFRLNVSNSSMYFDRFKLNVVDMLSASQDSQEVEVYKMNSGLFLGISRDLKFKNK